MRSGVFEKANFSGARLCGAKVEGARFFGAIFNGADLLRCEGLDNADLSGAFSNKLTVWPVDFDPVSHGIIVEK